MRRKSKLPIASASVISLAALAAVAVLAPWCFADDEFQELVNKIPRSANAVVILNLEKAKSSPMGLKEDWASKVEEAFESGLTRVPPQATRFVLASQIDFQFMEPLWEAAVIELGQDLSSKAIEQARHGTLDTIEGLPAVARPNDTYILKFAPRLVGAMGPANRQAVVRWIRDVRSSTPRPLSPYLQKAAVYSDKAGSDIIMAVDLDGVFSLERIGKYLKSRLETIGAVGGRSHATGEIAQHRPGSSRRRPHRRTAVVHGRDRRAGGRLDRGRLCQGFVRADHVRPGDVDQ